MMSRTGAAKGGYVSLTTVGAGSSAPILFGSNPMGDALLSTGLITLAGATAASMVPLLPVRMSGIDVCETVHRLDADAQAPTRERGITSANRFGEALGVLTLSWLVAPDGFEATPSERPPHTELDASRSQRFVMPDGVLRFEDRTRSGVRFFGAGRTYPSGIDGTTRLLFAGAAVVVEGLGSLKGLRGALTVVGEISARSLVSLIVAGRFDDDGPLEAADRLSPLTDSAGDGPDATLLTLAGESDGGEADGDVEERLRAVRIDNDLANASRPRSLFRAGVAMGHATGPLRFDASDRRCAVRLIDGRRELTFSDAAGQAIAGIVADALEGTAFPDDHAGEHVSRVIAYGELLAGTGALAGAGGVLTMDAAVSHTGRASTIYTLWLIDGRGRFRAPGVQNLRSIPKAAAAEAFQFVESSAGAILPADLAILVHAERTLAEGNQTRAWFQERDLAADFGERFEVVRPSTTSDDCFGFFDVAPIGGRQEPVMGIVQEIFYDRQKLGGPDAIRAQLKEFVLRYFMRVCDVRDPEPVPAGQSSTSALQRVISWLPDEGRPRKEMAYQQLFYKLADTGRIGKFTKDQRTAIVDLREIGTKYDWILLKVEIFSFDLPFAPFGAAAPKLQVPMKGSAYLVVGPAFITNIEDPAPGALAEYGFGYSFVPCAPAGPSVLAYGPGHFRVATQTVNFRLMADGEIRARAVFVVNRPDKIAAVDVDPVGWGVQLADLFTFRLASQLMSPLLALTDRLPLRASGFDPVAAYIRMANTMTGGIAEKHFGISKAALEKRMLLQHFKQQHEMLRGSLQAWRAVPDWTAHEQLSGSGQREG